MFLMFEQKKRKPISSEIAKIMERNELNDENCDSDVQYCKKPEPNPNYKKMFFLNDIPI